MLNNASARTHTLKKTMLSIPKELTIKGFNFSETCMSNCVESLYQWLHVQQCHLLRFSP